MPSTDPQQLWWLAIVALAAFIALLVKWLMARQDALHALNQQQAEAARKEALAREERLNKRADDHAEFSKTQVLTLQSIASRLEGHTNAIEAVPERVVQKLDEREIRLQQLRRPS